MMVNRQLESALKAPPMTIGIISSAFVSLQCVPRLVMGAFLLRRAAGGQAASMTESWFGNGRIGGTGEALATALSLRRRPLSSASWRHRNQRYGLRCRPIRYQKTVDERLNGMCKRKARERHGKDTMIRGRIHRLAGRFVFRSLDCEKLDLHKAVTDPPSQWHRECHSKGWKVT